VTSNSTQDHNTQQTTSLFKAMVKAQADFKKIDRSKSGYNYRYAPLDVVRNAVVPTLTKHGLTVIQFPISTDDDRIGVETTLAHESGESITRSFTTKLHKQDPQSVGSAITYYRRYSLLACLGLAPEDEDNDASDHTQPSAHEATTHASTVSDPADYIITFGKFKGQALSDIESKELLSWAEFMIKKKDLNGSAKEALSAVKAYLQSIAGA